MGPAYHSRDLLSAPASPPSEFIHGPTPGILTAWEFVTPEIALKWLNEQNNLNRPMLTQLHEPLTREMVEGRFQVTHQGIGFDENGQLTDGQHRLQGIVNSGVGQWLLVICGLPGCYATAPSSTAQGPAGWRSVWSCRGSRGPARPLSRPCAACSPVSASDREGTACRRSGGGFAGARRGVDLQ